MKKFGKGIILILAFIVWTLMISFVDVKLNEQTGTNIGFASLNCWFHQLTGVHMGIYVITDWLGLVPIFVCMIFGMLGLVQFNFFFGLYGFWKIDFRSTLVYRYSWRIIN